VRTLRVPLRPSPVLRVLCIDIRDYFPPESSGFVSYDSGECAAGKPHVGPDLNTADCSSGTTARSVVGFQEIIRITIGPFVGKGSHGSGGGCRGRDRSP
jgi:hypothetical protein